MGCRWYIKTVQWVIACLVSTQFKYVLSFGISHVEGITAAHCVEHVWIQKETHQILISSKRVSVYWAVCMHATVYYTCQTSE